MIHLNISSFAHCGLAAWMNVTVSQYYIQILRYLGFANDKWDSKMTDYEPEWDRIRESLYSPKLYLYSEISQHGQKLTDI